MIVTGSIGERQLGEADVRQIGYETFSAIEYVHALGYTHGDIKPGNFFVAAAATSTGYKIELADFEGARHVGDTDPVVRLNTHSYQTPEIRHVPWIPSPFTRPRYKEEDVYATAWIMFVKAASA